MKTIDMVYKKWQECFDEHPDPRGIEDGYRHFRLVLGNCKLDTVSATEIWSAMTICQRQIAEIAFKDGYRMGFRLRDEMEA